MATRSSALDNKVMESLKSWESSEHDPAKINELAGELEVSEAEIFNALGRLEDAGKVTGNGRGLTSVWWLGKAKEEPAKPTPSATPAERVKRKRRTKAEMDAAREEERKRREYGVRLAESQDMDFSQSPEHMEPKNGTPVPRAEFTSEGVKPLPAEVPVKAENGETVTVPVDYDDPSKGRRELDASKGERLLGESTYRRKVNPEVAELFTDAPKTMEAVQALIRKLQGLLPQEETEGFSVTFHEPKNGPELEGVEIPPLPAGVNANTWEMAYTANTESAREYWKRAAARQESDYANL